jgi:hypothetical protein
MKEVPKLLLASTKWYKGKTNPVNLAVQARMKRPGASESQSLQVPRGGKREGIHIPKSLAEPTASL